MYTATHRGRCRIPRYDPGRDRKSHSRQTVSNMALASVLSSDYAEFSFDNCQPFSSGCAPSTHGAGFDATPGDGLNFLVKNPLGAADEDGVERKIEFLHGTTTLAFKVSCVCVYSSI